MIILTRIYRINKRCVIANSVEEAIRIYKKSDDYEPYDDILRVEMMANGRYPDFALLEVPDEI